MNSSIILKGYHWPQSYLEETKEDRIFYLALNFTSRCNLRCPYCFVGHHDLNTSNEELTLKEKEGLIIEAKDLGAKVLIIPGRGEPFMDNDFWHILKFANSNGLWVVVYTNGFFLIPEDILKLKEAQISLYIKIDSFEPEVYDEMVGAKGAFSKFKKSLNFLLERFHEPEVLNGHVLSRLGFNSVVTRQSASSIPIIYDFCKKHKIYYTCRSPVKVGQADETWDHIAGDEVQTLRDIGSKYAARSFTSATEIGQCGIYRFGLTVENNGDIYVCPDAREGFKPIGNVKGKTLKDLIVLRNELFPINSEPGYCFVKKFRNPEEFNTAAI
jgi:MoaA/NifB/PqqE/SkfB family radical SAM enzyme